MKKFPAIVDSRLTSKLISKLQGDRIVKGAFSKTMKIFQEKLTSNYRVDNRICKNLVSVMKNRSMTLPSGVVETLTLVIISSSSQRTAVTSVTVKNKT